MYLEEGEPRPKKTKKDTVDRSEANRTSNVLSGPPRNQLTEVLSKFSNSQSDAFTLKEQKVR
jgi:hypothetical protein